MTTATRNVLEDIFSYVSSMTLSIAQLNYESVCLSSYRLTSQKSSLPSVVISDRASKMIEQLLQRGGLVGI